MSPSTTDVALDLDHLGAWLRARGVEVEGDLEARRVGRGHSNLTYRVTDAAGRSWVARRPPLGHLLPSAHDVVREARIMAALAGTGVPVPGIVGTCEDDPAAGAPVVVMEHVDGLVLDTLEVVAGVPDDVRREVGLGAARALAAVHEVDVDAVGLGDLARRTSYAARQLRRWSRQWESSRTRDLPLVDRLTGLLTAHVPEQTRLSLVHGDFHLRNVIVDPADGRLLAALDWELSTLGDPLADLGSTLAYWPEPGEDPHGMFAGSAQGGFPTRDELVEAYAAASGREPVGLGFWHVLGVWKVGVIAEGVLRRVQDEPANATEGEMPQADQITGLFQHAADLAAGYGLV